MEFTIFLKGLALLIVAVLGFLLLQPSPEAPPRRVSQAANGARLKNEEVTEVFLH